MTCQRVLTVIGAWFAFDTVAVLMWIAWCEWATRRETRRHDQPIHNDDTWLRFERATWITEGETA